MEVLGQSKSWRKKKIFEVTKPEKEMRSTKDELKVWPYQDSCQERLPKLWTLFFSAHNFFPPIPRAYFMFTHNFFASLFFTNFLSAGLLAAHCRTNWLLDWSLAAKWAWLLITQLTAAYPTHPRSNEDAMRTGSAEVITNSGLMHWVHWCSPQRISFPSARDILKCHFNWFHATFIILRPHTKEEEKKLLDMLGLSRVQFFKKTTALSITPGLAGFFLLIGKQAKRLFSAQNLIGGSYRANDVEPSKRWFGPYNLPTSTSEVFRQISCQQVQLLIRSRSAAIVSVMQLKKFIEPSSIIICSNLWEKEMNTKTKATMWTRFKWKLLLIERHSKFIHWWLSSIWPIFSGKVMFDQVRFC